jgi:polyhydroxyalkanoate synthase
MSAPTGLDLASIPDRIQSEVQRAIQRSIKDVEYLASSGPALGLTPKDLLSSRGTMNLYLYRPMADELYRIPVLIVMATGMRAYPRRSRPTPVVACGDARQSLPHRKVSRST